MKYRVRCMNKHAERKTCFTRKSLDKHPDQYESLPACRNCGSNEYWNIDKYRQSKQEAKDQKNCNCNGHIWSCADGFHRYGSKGCIHREEFLLESAAKGNGGIKSQEMLF